MRAWRLTILAAGALTMAAAPADAAWKNYVSHKLGVVFAAPGEMKTSSGESRGAYSGPQETMIFSSAENNIQYRLTVTNYQQAKAYSATILGEAEFMFQEGKRVVSTTFGRIGSGKDMNYGRKIAIELPGKKGRTAGAFYFANGYLFEFEATVLPAAGNPDSPDAERFLNSIGFDAQAAKAGAAELSLPE